MRRPTKDQKYEIVRLISQGLTYQDAAKHTGFTFGQVKKAMEPVNKITGLRLETAIHQFSKRESELEAAIEGLKAKVKELNRHLRAAKSENAELLSLSWRYASEIERMNAIEKGIMV
jgi:chromosome segregation ATPase